MIVMGTQGASGLKEVFIGSTTNGVIEGTKLPVLVVPSVFDYRPLKTIALSLGNRMINNKTSLESLRMIIYRYDADVCSFHIRSNSDVEIGHLKQSLDDALGNLKSTFQEIESDEKDINSTIQEFVKKENADLLCMIKHDRGFWGNLLHSSVTTKEVFHSTVPILVLHS